jgi:hypothetical protein
MNGIQFDFEVGEKEKHKVEFIFNRTWGNIIFNVDGKRVYKTMLWFAFSTNIPYKIIVGEKERHNVEVLMIRPLWFAGFRGGWKFNVSIDGKPFKEYTG